MAITVQKLFENITAEIPSELLELQVKGMHYDSRKIEKDFLFIAVKGFQSDGHKYLKQVAVAGALAAVVEDFDETLNLPQIKVENSREVMAYLAYNFYRQQVDALKLVGITGTNGKTSCAFLLRSILNEAGIQSGLMGTIAYFTGNAEVAAWNTTPEALDICRMLSEMHANNMQAAVLEVSSHALALNRVDGLQFDLAMFTNLSRDHLDFHKDENDYFEAKAHLFDLLKPTGKAVVNLDDPFGRKLKERLQKHTLSYGFAKDADLQVVSWKGSTSGLQIKLKYNDQIFEIESQLIGTFNVSNLVAVIAAALALDINIPVIQKALKEAAIVPGRLQAFQLKEGVTAVIDYAHTPDALQKAIEAIREIMQGRLIVLFGAGGNRDKGKRPQMGKVAEKLADLAIVTTDNPRSEEPQTIINDILAGMKKPEKRKVIVDRREAIYEAVKMSRPGDVILIAGKGHETYQEINGQKFDFDEAAILKEALAHA